ncbi:MFS transporter [Streptomyces griseus]|uniref:MFS transporter n=1 Tax=Streptomyces griseus TaxID=1911 RepID=UPI0007C778E1|nr:MFS transporter [Streptomyces griseus]
MYLADGRDRPGRGSAADGTRPTGRVPSVVWALGAVSLLTDVSAEMVTAVLPLYLVAGLGLSPLGVGLVDGLQHGVTALVRVLAGHAGDRWGRHKAVAGAGYALSALCKPLLLAAQGLASVGAVIALDRIGKGVRTAPRDALIVLASAPEARGRAFGAHRALDTAGALLGPLLAFAVLLAAPEGAAGPGAYDAVFTVSACAAALGLAVLLLLVPGGPVPGTGAEAAGAVRRPRLAEAAGLLRDRRLRRLLGHALWLGGCTVGDAFVYLVLQRRTGLSDGAFALLPPATAAVFLLLAAPLGRLADRFGRWRVFLGGHVALLGVYGLLLGGTGSPVLLVVVPVLHGAFYAATDGVLMAAASALLPAGLGGTGLALVQSAQALARFGASVVFGALWQARGDRFALAAAAVALALAVVAAGRPAPAAPAAPVPPLPLPPAREGAR